MSRRSTISGKLLTLLHFAVQDSSYFQILTCKSQLAVLHQSPHWLGDGTFDARPLDIQPHFSQLYMIYGLIESECKMAVMALTPDRRIATYEQLFTTIRTLLVSNFQTVGQLNWLHFDQEQATITAARNVFGPNVNIRTCGFHFAKNVLDRIKQNHLYTLYQRDPNRGYNVPPFSEFYTYVRRLITLMVLNPINVLPAFNTNFAQPPNMNVADLDNRIAEFVQYFRNQWMNNQDKINSWNHFDHSGPRTTNYAEAFNGSLAGKFQVTSYQLNFWNRLLYAFFHLAQASSFDGILDRSTDFRKRN